jgi:hypothetical protein
MAITETIGRRLSTTAARGAIPTGNGQPRDLQRTFQLVMATIWLLDAVLQIQPFMFTSGRSGFSGMLNGLAPGNPGWVAHTMTWNGSIIYHQPVLTNTLFALIQFVIGFGIVWKKALKPALALSIVWAVGVWWFGEGSGGIFHGAATPFGGGPGGVLFYAVLAVLLWPSERSNEPFVAARAVGLRAARAIWVGTWTLLAILSVVGSGRSPQALHDLVSGMNNGQPGWLAHIDRVSESFFLQHGTPAAILLAIVCLIVAAGVFLPPQGAQVTLVVAIAVFAVIWVAVQDFGGILAGGATDPNSGPLVIVLALLYWPLTTSEAEPAGPSLNGIRTMKEV